jgi:endoglucanase
VTTRRTGVLFGTALFLAAAVTFASVPPGHALLRTVLAWPVEWHRARQGAADPLQRLAASQVGYAPEMPKRFTSPRPFSSFRVAREKDGSTAFEGPGPAGPAPVPGWWIGDFSALREPGRYRLEAAGLSSHPFEIGAGVFDGPVRAVQRAFYFQRAFTAIEPAHAEGPWVHGDDGPLAPPGVVGGWHDAGDFSVYSASLNSTLYWLLRTYADFAPADDQRNIPESGNGVPDLLDEARWGLRWLLSNQEPGGGFRNASCLSDYGPYGTNSPESARPYVRGEPGTLATARAVGNLAFASVLFRPFDAEFSARALSAARQGQEYLDRHPESSDGPTCPAYRADGDQVLGAHTRMFAAAAMLLATGEARYREDFERHLVPLDEDPSYMKIGGFGADLYLRAPAGEPRRKAALREALGQLAASSRSAGRSHPFERSAPTFWGSIAAGFVRTGFSSVPACLRDPLGGVEDCAQALANVHHALGRNPLHFCYVSGLDGVSHGRLHAFHHWLASLRARPFLFPGLVAGGPNDSPEPRDGSRPLARPIPIWGYWGDPAFPRDGATPDEERYTDNDSWSTNEVSMDWQAATLYGLAFAQWVAQHPGTQGHHGSPPGEAKLRR